MSVSLNICLFVPNDIANRYRYYSPLQYKFHRSWEGLKLFWGRVTPPNPLKVPLETSTRGIATSNLKSKSRVWPSARA